MATVTTPREITDAKMTKWIERQVAAALSVLHDIKPEGHFEDLVRLGRVKRRRAKKFAMLLSAGKASGVAAEERNGDDHI